MRHNIVVLGSTGSVGRQTLEVASACPEKVSVYGLAANRNARLLDEQARTFGVRAVSVSEDAAHGISGDRLEVLTGDEGMVELASRPDVDLVVVATAGRAGLLPALAALESGKLVALANKETLVMAGGIIQEAIRSGSGRLVPIDSEHSAIWQCLQGESLTSVEKLILTASGGALRHLTLEQLGEVTPEAALRHPTWSMGPKITIDSANLMNKGLEAIEARWLFDLPLERIDIVMHPQSIVHSLVVFQDSSVKAQLGLPDMRLPIQYALSHPERWPNSLQRLDLAAVGSLTFDRVDYGRYPALRMALEAGRRGGTFPAVLSAADDVAVDAFLQGLIPFTVIPGVVEETLEAHDPCSSPNLPDILEADRWARSWASALVASRRAR